MRRFFQSSPPKANGTLALEGAEAGHAVKVIRIGVGDRAVVLDGAGNEYVCQATAVDRKRVEFFVEERMFHPSPRTELKLYQSIIRGKSFEFVLQKAVELGATEVVPVLSERVVAKIGVNDTADKLARWNHVAVEAIKQCGAAWLPRISDPVSLNDALAHDQSTDLRFVASLREQVTHPRVIFEEFQSNYNRLPESVSVWIGPEGDFSEDEYRRLNRDGVAGVSFGERVLRSETASVYALSVLAYEISSPR